MKINYRYKKIILKASAITALLGFVVLAATPSVGGISNAESSVAYENMDKTEKEEILDPQTSFSFKGTETLKKDAYPEINELITAYYNAMYTYNMDALEGYVSDITQIDQTKLMAQLEYMESINNIVCYTVEGNAEGSFRVYVYYDMKIRGIETVAPALSALYVTMSSDGRYIVYLSELDGDTQEFINQTDASEEVQVLKQLVNDRFQSVLQTDEQLKSFCEMLESGSGKLADEVSGDALEASAE